jgi:NodT family efflux transporter outer membrane factor (OMF) lipoprotein
MIVTTRLRIPTANAVRLAALSAVLLSGCDLAPVYDPPHLLLPDSYQGTGPFQVAHPEAELSSRGDWWVLFGDPELNKLEDELQHANPTLEAAAETYNQARDLAAEALSQLAPQIGIDGGVSDNKQSANRLFRGGGGPNVQASNEIYGAASWEPDFWDAIRNGARAQKRLAQAGAADFATARLSLEVALANDYATLRGLDVQLEVLRQSIVSYEQAVLVTQLRSDGQIASGLDLARASSQLSSAKAQRTDAELQRDLTQHAIAVLVGAMPSGFSIEPAQRFTLEAPEIPTGLPSKLLQRRPDIASAERHMAAANATIGVSRAAFYPNITLFGAAGFQDSGFNLLSLPNSLWSVGAGAVLPLFEGGLRRAELQRSWSQYAQTRDDYRVTVLAAFQDVEDGMSLTQRLAVEVTEQRKASEQADAALSISTLLYKDGLDNYLSVSIAQVQALAAELVDVQLRVRQVQASISLVRAVGGGWSAQELPSESKVVHSPRFPPRDIPVSALQ